MAVRRRRRSVRAGDHELAVKPMSVAERLDGASGG
jgi:hypothetical protein